MTALGLLIVAIIFLPIVVRRERLRRQSLEEEDLRERQQLAYLEHIANGRSGPPPQVNRAQSGITPSQAKTNRQLGYVMGSLGRLIWRLRRPALQSKLSPGESHFDCHRRLLKDLLRRSM